MFKSDACSQDPMFTKLEVVRWYDYFILAIVFLFDLIIAIIMAWRRQKEKYQWSASMKFLNGNMNIPLILLSAGLSLVGIAQHKFGDYYGRHSVSFVNVLARACVCFMIFPFWKVFRKADVSIGKYIFRRFRNRTGCTLLFSMLLATSFFTIVTTIDGIAAGATALRMDFTTFVASCVLYATVTYKLGGMPAVCCIGFFRLAFIYIARILFIGFGQSYLKKSNITFYKNAKEDKDKRLFLLEAEEVIVQFIFQLGGQFTLLFGTHTGLQFFNSASSLKSSLIVLTLSLVFTTILYVLTDVSVQIVRAFYHDSDPAIDDVPLFLFYYHFLDDAKMPYLFGLLATSEILLSSFQILATIQTLWVEIVTNANYVRKAIERDTTCASMRDKGVTYIGIATALVLAVLLNGFTDTVQFYSFFNVVNRAMIPLVVVFVWLSGFFPQITIDGMWSIIPCALMAIVWLLNTDSSIQSFKYISVGYRYVQRNGTPSNAESLYKTEKFNVQCHVSTFVMYLVSLIIITKAVKGKRKVTDDELYIKSALRFWTGYYIRRRMQVRQRKRMIVPDRPSTYPVRPRESSSNI